MSLFLLAAAPGRNVSALPADPPVPPGFHLELSSLGVDLYQKDYSGGNPDFVQVVDLSQGATVRPLFGDIRDPRAGRGIYGGGDPSLQYESLQQFWNEFSAQQDSAFCVTNGQFFYMLENPTRLPFALKVDDVIISDGYDAKSYPGQKLMLELWDGHADIAPLTGTDFYASSAPNIVAGLAEDANKRAKYYVGRTFVGVGDGNQDGLYETIYIFNTKTARQVDAAEVLRSFGAQKVMMLDGGGSTQLICRNSTLVASERLIPQALGVAAGMAPVPTPTPVNTVRQLERVDQAKPPKEPSLSLAATSVPSQTPLESAVHLVPETPAQLSKATFSLSDVIWIPLVMSPFAMVLVVVIRAIRPDS